MYFGDFVSEWITIKMVCEEDEKNYFIALSLKVKAIAVQAQGIFVIDH